MHCRPQELDEAARRRFVKRLYVPLPGMEGRQEILCKLLMKQTNNLTKEQIIEVSNKTDGKLFISFTLHFKNNNATKIEYDFHSSLIAYARITLHMHYYN